MRTCCTRTLPAQVAEEVEAQLQKYKAAVDEINAKTGDGDAAAGPDGVVVDHEELLRRNTQHLMSAVSSLPELQVRGRAWHGCSSSSI